jgi:hypothetical protein
MIAWETSLAYEQIALASLADPAPRAAMLAAWRAGGFDAAILAARAADARVSGRIAEAERWERRATLARP